jgi:hypothetical protein
MLRDSRIETFPASVQSINCYGQPLHGRWKTSHCRDGSPQALSRYDGRPQQLTSVTVHRCKTSGSEDEMKSIEHVATKSEVIGRNLLGWTRPLAARIWISILLFLR